PTDWSCRGSPRRPRAVSRPQWSLQSRHADQCERPCGGLHLVNGGEHGGADDSNRAVVITVTTCSALGKPTHESVFHRGTKTPQARSMPTPETSHTTWVSGHPRAELMMFPWKSACRQ